MIFDVITSHPQTGEKKNFKYDNTLNVLSDSNGNVFEYSERQTPTGDGTKPFSKNDPLKKSTKITTLKIQLGLSCNYTCDYCSQRFVERPPETSKKDIDAFMSKLEVLDFNEQDGLRIEFWGGEPLVYWKTLKPLAEAITEKFSHWKDRPSFGMVTNGSLLTREICSWLYYMNFGVGISHDGPGQPVRGPDPFDDPAQKEIILEFYKIMSEQNRISFNVMMNKTNNSRKEVYDWFVKNTGIENISIGEGSFIDAYDAAAIDNSLETYEDHFNYRRTAFNDITATDGKIGFNNILNRVDGFMLSLLNHVDVKYVGQKCGMDDERTIAVDLKGNIVTCQNVSIMETSKNGESHLGGNLEDYANVQLSSSTHWKNRANCSECPVIHLCRGSCMYLEGECWDVTCDNAYSDNIALFAVTISRLTGGFVPIAITSDSLPLYRQDIWGTLVKHEEKPKKKSFPIKVVVEKTGTIDDIEIYGKTKLGE